MYQPNYSVIVLTFAKDWFILLEKKKINCEYIIKCKSIKNRVRK